MLFIATASEYIIANEAGERAAFRIAQITPNCLRIVSRKMFSGRLPVI